MAEVNSVIVMGNLVADPRKFEGSTDAMVCWFTIAMNHRYVKADGEKVEEPHYFDVVCFGSLAQSCLDHIEKGSRVVVQGRLQWHKRPCECGKPGSKVSIAARSVEFITWKKESNDD